MKQFLKKKWAVPIGALVLTLAIGSAAFAATGTSSTSTSAPGSTSETGSDSTAAFGDCDGTRTGSGPHGRSDAGQRSDETPLTGDELSKAQAAALAAPEVGSDAAVMRAETDADGNGTYEVHVKKADGTMMTVYLDESFNVVETEEGHAGGQHRGGMRERDDDGTAAPSTEPAATTAS